MASPGKVLHPVKQNQGECHEAHGKDIMVNEVCPKKKSVSLSERMFANAAYRAGEAVGVDHGNRPGGTACGQNPYPASASRSQAS